MTRKALKRNRARYHQICQHQRAACALAIATERKHTSRKSLKTEMAKLGYVLSRAGNWHRSPNLEATPIDLNI